MGLKSGLRKKHRLYVSEGKVIAMQNAQDNIFDTSRNFKLRGFVINLCYLPKQKHELTLEERWKVCKCSCQHRRHQHRIWSTLISFPGSSRPRFRDAGFGSGCPRRS